MAAMGRLGVGTSSGVDHHEVTMAPLDVFMKLNASNGVPVLPEYAFALCELGSWPFPSTMGIDIIPEACLAYDTPVGSENQLDETANAVPVTNSGVSKKHKCKGKSKGRSKSAGATSSASEASPCRNKQGSHSDATLASQVTQDLEVSSEGSDSDNPNKTQQDALTTRDSQLLVDTTQPESGSNPPGTTGSDPDALAAPHMAETAEVTPPETGTLVTKPVLPNSTEGIAAQPVATSTGSIWTSVPPGFPQQATSASTNPVPPVPPGTRLGHGVGIPTHITDRSMTYLAQSLAVSSAGSTPDIGAFSGVMTALRKACGLMSEGFQEACLEVELVVQTTLAEAMVHDWTFAAKAAEDLDLLTSALQPLFDTNSIPEAEMETRHAMPAPPARDQHPDLDTIQRSNQGQISGWGTRLDSTTPVLCQGRRMVYENLRESCRGGS